MELIKKIKNDSIARAIIIFGLVVAGAIIYVGYSQKKCGPEGALSSNEAANQVVEFINKNLLVEGATASLVETNEENGLYKIKFDIKDDKGNENKGIEVFASKDGKLLFPEWIDTTQVIAQNKESEQSNKKTTVGQFTVNNEEVCKENGKPIVYFFGLNSCPHCRWEHPIIESVAKKFGSEIVFKNNMDNNEDRDIFQKYSNGGVPTLVLGCKYSRIGSGENVGKEQEEKDLTALICKLTNNKPMDVCSQVKDLVDQIE